MGEYLPGDVDAHVAKGFIQLVHMIQLLKRLLGFDLSTHSDIVHTLVAQDYLHINAPIKIVERYEDSSCQSC